MDAWLILFLIAYLMVTDLVAEGARAALRSVPRDAAGRRRSRPSRGRSPATAPGAPPVDLRILLVDPPGRHPLLRQLPALLEALPHHHVRSQHLLHEPRADGQAPDGGPREHRAVRRREGGGPHLEADARRLHVHGVRSLPRRVPDGADRQASRPEDLHRQRARRRLRGDAGDPRGGRRARQRSCLGRRASRPRSEAGSPRTRSGPARRAASARRPARSSSSRPSTRSWRCAATSSSTRPSSRRRSRTPSAAWRPTETRGTSRPPPAATGPRAFRSRRWPRRGRRRSRSSSGSAARAPTRTAPNASRRPSSRS